MSINLGRVVVVCALAVSLSPAGSGAVLDAYDDFTSSNPSGPWSYGYTPTLNGVFNTFTDFYAAPAPGAFGHEAAWREESVDTYLGLYKTSSPGLLLSHPGTAGQFAVLRFTAPSAGDYTVSSAFSGIDAATTDVYVYANGISIFAGSLNGLGDTTAFSQLVSLSAGQVVDLIVGYGSNFTSDNDATGLRAQISDVSAIPEPGSVFLLMTGLALIAAAKSGRIRPRR